MVKNSKVESFSYLGSKRYHVEQYFDIFTEFVPNATTFVEPFGGSGVCSLNAANRGLKAYYNELDKDVFHLFKWLLSINDENVLIDSFEWLDYDSYNKLRKKDNLTPQEILLRKLFSFRGIKDRSYFMRKEDKYSELTKELTFLTLNKAFDLKNIEKNIIRFMEDYNYIHTLQDKENILSELKGFINYLSYFNSLETRSLLIRDFFLKLTIIIQYRFYNVNNIKVITQSAILKQLDNNEIKCDRHKKIDYYLKDKVNFFRLQVIAKLKLFLDPIKIKNKHKILCFNRDFRDFRDFRDLNPSTTIIYLDPPYLNTEGYNVGKFDYQAFIDYLDTLQDYCVFISEYSDEVKKKGFEVIKIKDNSINRMNNRICEDKLFYRRPQK